MRFFLSGILAAVAAVSMAGCSISGSKPAANSPAGESGNGEIPAAVLESAGTLPAEESADTPAIDDAHQGGLGKPDVDKNFRSGGSAKTGRIKYPTKWVLSPEASCKEISIPQGATSVAYFEPAITNFKSARDIAREAADKWRAGAPDGKIHIAEVLGDNLMGAATRQRVFVSTPRPPAGVIWRIESQSESINEQVDRFLDTDCKARLNSLALDANTKADFAWHFRPIGICRYEAGGRRYFVGKGELACVFATFTETNIPPPPQ